MVSLRITSILELNNWLKQNYTHTESVWLEFKKKSAGGDFAMNEIIDELLCWGWIDSLPRKVDDVWTSVRISPRNPKSRWSRVNKNKIAELEKQNRIQPSGKRAIEIAQENGAWDALNDVENLILPEDFKAYLVEHDLMSVWEAKTRSYRRGFLEQLLDAKKPATRMKRFAGLD